MPSASFLAPTPPSSPDDSPAPFSNAVQKMKEASTDLRVEVGTEGVGLMNPCATSFMPVSTPGDLPIDVIQKGIEVYEPGRAMAAVREAKRRGSRGEKVIKVCRTLVGDDDFRGESKAIPLTLMHTLA